MKDITNQLQAEYFRKRTVDWPFLKLLLVSNTRLNEVSEEIMFNFNMYAHQKGLASAQYSELLDEAFGILYEINSWVKCSLGREDIDRFIRDGNMESYTDDYAGFWSHQEYTMSQYLNESIEFPSNIDELLPNIVEYIQCPYLDSKILSWSLVEIIIFKELNAYARSNQWQTFMLKKNFLSFLPNKKRKNAQGKNIKVLGKMYNIYVQCSPLMFHPKVIIELCLEMRKEGDYYEGILFELLDRMVEQKQYRIDLV